MLYLLLIDKYFLFFFVVLKIGVFFAYRKTINDYRKTKEITNKTIAV